MSEDFELMADVADKPGSKFEAAIVDARRSSDDANATILAWLV